MNLDDKKISEILLREEYIDQTELKKASEIAAKNHTSLVDYLLSNGLITKSLLGQAIAESFNLNYIDLQNNPPSKDHVQVIPEKVAKKYMIVITEGNKAHITVASSKPDQTLQEVLKKLFPHTTVTLAYSFPDDITATFIHYKKSLETRFVEAIKNQKRVAPEIIQEIFNDAFIYNASDIHFEPNPSEVVIRFRIDGVLNEAGRLPKEYYENIINRIKVQAHLRIDEHFSVQDGAIQIDKDGTTSDIRVSVVPTVDGEKIVLRLLASLVRNFTLEDLGLSQHEQLQLTNAINKPFGMILVTGPTGSGKTTTLYALVKKLNNPEINITTIEDPVEYKIPGVNHIQVAPAKEITFAQGLRSIVRQDPDVILVGEIRDHETADIATNAALTGHLLFTTFHANDSATAIPRLLGMGVEPFLVASTLNMIIAQRLARKICQSCRYSVSFTKEEFIKKFPSVKIAFEEKHITIYQGKGCSMCNNTGFKGRIALFEIIAITPEMQDLILQDPSTKEIWELAIKQGSQSLFSDGIEKVKTGITTIEEVLRVATPK